MKNKNYIWRPVSEYTGGRVLATNGMDVLIGEINSDGDCESEENGSTILCGITGFVKIEEMLPKLAESGDERIRKSLIGHLKECRNNTRSEVMIGEYAKWIAWLEKQDETFTKKDVDDAYLKGVCDTKHELEKQGEQNTTKDYSTLEITDVVRQALQECESFSNIRADVYAARVGATVEKLIKKQGEQKPDDKVDSIVVKDFNSVFSKEQVEEIDKRIEESQRRYNANLRDAMRKVKDFPMTD